MKSLGKSRVLPDIFNICEGSIFIHRYKSSGITICQNLLDWQALHTYRNHCHFRNTYRSQARWSANPNDIGIDMLSASAHKFNDPKGIGFLYIKKGNKIAPYMDGGMQENGCRAGTENIASIVGMATALKINCDSLESNLQFVMGLERRLIAGINEAGISYTRNGEATLPGLISLSFPDADGETILHRMDLMGISISTGSACDSVNTDISHVLRAIYLDERLAKGTVRISLGKNNTESEIDEIVAALIKIFKP